MMRRTHADGREEYLSCYAPGSGCLAFCWMNADGIATSRKVTLSHARQYLSVKKLADHLQRDGWKPGVINEQVILIPPVARCGTKQLSYKGETYQYNISGGKDGEETDVDFHSLEVFYETHGGTIHVMNLSVRNAICFYLQHEEEILKQREDTDEQDTTSGRKTHPFVELKQDVPYWHCTDGGQLGTEFVWLLSWEMWIFRSHDAKTTGEARELHVIRTECPYDDFVGSARWEAEIVGCELNSDHTILVFADSLPWDIDFPEERYETLHYILSGDQITQKVDVHEIPGTETEV